MGAQGYFLLARKPDAKYGFWGIGIVTVAVMITGTRTPFVFVVGSAFVMTAAFLWGAPWRWGQGHRLVKALRRGFLIGGIGLILMFDVFPTVIGGSWAFISETLGSETGQSDLSGRGWDYPVQNLMEAFEEGNLVIGHGTGMSSLGMQYVSRILGEPAPNIGVESGFGVSDRGDGHIWSDPLADLVHDPSLAGMENCKEASRNRLFSIGLRDLVVRRGGSSFVHALDHGPLSEFCKQRQLVAAGRCIVSPASPRARFPRRSRFQSICAPCPAGGLLWWEDKVYRAITRMRSRSCLLHSTRNHSTAK